MDELTDCHTEWSKTEEDKYTVPLICGILKKSDTNELSYKTQTDSET